MKVSVIIPAYNEEAYIKETLAAVAAQDHRDLEIIVIDNNSKDRTKELVADFISTLDKTLGVKMILVEEKKPGVQKAREKGRSMATGELVANLDADCLPPNAWLSKAVRYFEDKKVMAVTGPYDYFDGGRWLRFGSLIMCRVLYRPASTIFGFFRKAIFIGGNAVIRSSALDKIGGYDTTIAFFGDDVDTGNRLVKFGKVLYRNDLVIRSSARRFKILGTKAYGRYFINFIWIIFFKRPYHTEMPDEVPR